MQYAFSENYFT